MVPKLKTRMKPVKKRLTTRIRTRAQSDLLSSDGDFTTEDESEPTLGDVLGTLTTTVAATEDKLSASSRHTSEAPPPLTGSVTMFTLPPFIPDGPQSEGIQPRDTLSLTYEDSGQDEPSQVSG